MATEIKVWEVKKGKLEPVEGSMADAKRREKDHLEQWIKTDASILGQDILIIGEQVSTKTGAADFIAIDKAGNIIVVELKRDMLPRAVLTQALDYASDIATWDVDKLSEICFQFTKQGLEDSLTEKFSDIDLEDLTINQNQRILLVGFSIEEALQRMVEWLSDNYNVSINAIVLKYVKTQSGDELLTRTMIISEEIEKERIRKRQFKIQTSDEPGQYSEDELKELLMKFLSRPSPTIERIRSVFLPLCLRHEVVTRNMIIKELVKQNYTQDEGQAGYLVVHMSRVMTVKSHDYLRQIVTYERTEPAYPWVKDNYRLVDKYKDLVQEVLANFSHTTTDNRKSKNEK